MHIDLDDGLTFDPIAMTLTTMREDDEYGGLRIRIPCLVPTARLVAQVDMSFGDPIPGRLRRIPAMLEGELAGVREFRMLTYSLEALLAEKIVTMVSRGDANTRDRDFGDVWLIGQQFEVDADTLLHDMRRTAEHRVVELRPLSGVLDDIRAARRDLRKRYRARTGMDVLPETFGEVLDFCLWFADPLVLGDAAGSTWSPTEQRWTR